MEIKKEKVEGTNEDLVWAQMRYCPYWPARVCKNIYLVSNIVKLLDFMHRLWKHHQC